MKVRLISLPWMDFKMPQPALGVLASYLQEKEPSWIVETDYTYLDIAKQGPEVYDVIAQANFEGERIYATLVYPERTENLIASWSRLPPDHEIGAYLSKMSTRGVTARVLVETMRARLEKHLDQIVAERDWNDTIVGLTTSFSQLFANIALAKRIKATGANATIVLGGSTVSPSAISDSLLATYSCIDYIVRGEGEKPFHALIKHLQSGDTGPTPRGVVSRESASAVAGMWQVDDLDSLPTPNYDAFFERAGRTDGRFSIPIEGSRGCWWDRTAKSTKSTCQFCNLNVQWEGFRQKSARRVAEEMRQLSERYRCTHFEFLDNIVRHRGYDEFIAALRSLQMTPRIFHEARANLRPPEILQFAEAGLRVVQFGLEGLSTSFLRRINKGTTLIMNLEVMKTCAELNVQSKSNLIIGFPGSTQTEVEETLEAIDRYAYAYEPAHIAGFELGIDSVVARFPDTFGLTNIRNHDRYAEVIPPDELAKLTTFQWSYDSTPLSDWTPVWARVEQWKEEYKPHPVWYSDGGSFLHVHRRRHGKKLESVELVGDEAHLYRYCTMIRTRAEILERFPEAETSGALAKMLSTDIMYREGNKYLSLAVAPDPLLAVKRIRELEALEVPKPRRVALTMAR